MNKAVALRFLVAAGMVAGCSGEISRPGAGSLKEGLNFLDAKDPAWGLNAAYLKAGRVVYLESRMGVLKPEAYREAWPDDPPSEMDLRFVDQNGLTFASQMGGDHFADSTWQSDMIGAMKKHPDVVPGDERDLDFQLAQEAAVAAKVALPGSFKDHVYHLAIHAATPTPYQGTLGKAKLAKVMAVPVPVEVPKNDTGYSNYGSSWLGGNWNMFETDLYSGSTAVIAHHSPTLMWQCQWNGSSCTWNWNAMCNHGRCWNDSGISYQCYSWTGGWVYNTWVTGESNCSGSGDACPAGGTAVTGGCNSSYSWSTYSGWWFGDSNTHLCNDDASYELWQGKTGTSATSQGDGNSFHYVDANDNDYACYCNSSHDCDGDWSIPACP